jgi:Txe/YoeB family toxin of Txe-Axe toxin-antitoxin module
MIHAESKKLHLIEFLIKEDDEAVLNKIETILTAAKEKPVSGFDSFSNNLSKEELDAFERNIDDGCEHTVIYK